MSWTFRKYWHRVGKFYCICNGAPLEVVVDFKDKIVELHCESLFFDVKKITTKKTLFLTEEEEDYDEE